jgi:hypothetical protein
MGDTKSKNGWNLRFMVVLVRNKSTNQGASTTRLDMRMPKGRLCLAPHDKYLSRKNIRGG